MFPGVTLPFLPEEAPGILTEIIPGIQNRITIAGTFLENPFFHRVCLENSSIDSASKIPPPKIIPPKKVL